MSEASARKVDGYVTVEVTPSSRKDGLPRRVGMVGAEEPKDDKVPPKLVAPLFDASILSRGVMMLRGIEIGSGRDEAKDVELVSEHHQVWRRRPHDGSRLTPVTAGRRCGTGQGAQESAPGLPLSVEDFDERRSVSAVSTRH